MTEDQGGGAAVTRAASGAATFGAFLQASRPGRSRVRRRRAVVLSAITHGVVLAGFLLLRPPVERSAPAVPEPIFLRLPPPGRPPAPAQAAVPHPPPRPLRRPRPAVIVQPPPEPPVVQELPEEPPEPIEELPEEPEGPPSEEDAGPPEPAAPAAAPVGRPGSLAGSQGDAVLELKDVARAPTVLAQVKPEYPGDARRKGVKGLVILRVVVGLDGRIEPGRTRVVRSVPELDQAAIAALEQWRFSPAIDHAGRPVRVVIEVPINFNLR